MFDFRMQTYEKDDLQFEITSRQFFIKILLIFGFPTIGYFIIQDFLSARHFISFFLLLMFTTLIALFFALRYPAEEKKKYIIYRILLTFFLFLFGTYLIYAIGVQQTFYRLYWCYLFPILVFYAMGIKEGLLWISVFYACISLLVLFSEFQSIAIESLKTRFLISFFLVSFMSFVSAYLMRRDQHALLTNQQTLRNEIEERKHAEEALRRSEEEAKRLAQESAIMAQIGRIITSSFNIEEVYERFAEEVRKFIPFDGIVVNTINAKNDTVTISYVSGTDVPERRPGHIIPLRGTATAECARTRSGFLVQTENMEEIEGRYPGLLPSFEVGLRSFIMVPLFSEDEVIGVLSVRSSRPNAYTETDLRLIERIGHQIAGAIANAQLFAERKQVEETLLERERFLNNIFSSIQDGLSILDKEFTIVRVNPAIEQWYSHAMPLIGKKCYEAYHERTERCEFCPTYQTVKTGRVAYEVVPKTGSGGKIVGWLELYSFPLVDAESGKIKGIIEYVRDITERKLAEEELQTQKQRFQTLSENAPFGMMMVDQEGHYKYINPKFTELFGYDLEDIPDGRVWFRKAYPDPTYRHHVISTWVKDLESSNPGEKRSRTFTVTCKDGTQKMINFTPVQLETGENLMTCEDITERKRAEEALRESEERYRTILENIEDGYYETDLPGDLTFFNDSLCRMLGYSKDEMMGMSNKQYTDEENRKKLFQAFNEVYRTGKPTKAFDWGVFTKDGKKLFGEVSVSLIKDSKGQPTGFRGIARDITQRKQAEEALRTEKQRFQTFLENAPFGMIVVGQGGNFKYINSKFIELFGYELNEIPGGREWFRKAYPDPEYRHHVIETWINDSNISGHGEKIPRIFTVHCKDETKKIIRFITVQLETEEYLMSCEDITLIQRAEEEKATLEEQLRQSQKMEAIGRLAGGIAHDFNNLLTVIRGYSQLSLMDLKENEKLKVNLDEIQKATQRASDLTHHLLAFSRRQIMEMKILDLNTLLKDLDKMLHRVIGEDIELTYLLSDDIGKVRVDPGQMEQVILNLAVNARDAMPSGGKLTIETSNAELDEAYAHAHIGSKPGRYVMMSVSDTGLGMSPEVRERAFEPFFTTKEKGKGTGLGLSTCYGIVKQSGGNIWAYSEPGRGTIFKIYLPWVGEFPKETNHKPEAAEILKGTETILAVEDEIEVRKLVAQILTGQGYTVIEASDGEEAVKVARDNADKKIQLLLTDVVMPGMSGRELAETLALLHPGLKILYMSGYTDNAIVHHGVLEEGVNYIQKPFTLDALARKVREVLDQRG
jgi:PAS domain S-box-containing protein